MNGLILLDLDGTLLRSDATISGYSAGVLEKCRQSGFCIVFSTSRGLASISPFLSAFRPDYVIASSGALVCRVKEDHGENDPAGSFEILRKAGFSAEEASALIRSAFRELGTLTQITVDTEFGHLWHLPEEDRYGLSGFEQSIVADLTDFASPALKICVQTDDPETASRIADGLPGCLCQPFSDIPWHKYTNGGVSKEDAAKWLSSFLSIPFEKMIAFGDDVPDLETIRMAGLGLAPANAIPDVRAAADGVIGSNDEDGPARFLDEYLSGLRK